MNKNYFEFTLRGGHGSLNGKPDVCKTPGFLALLHARRRLNVNSKLGIPTTPKCAFVFTFKTFLGQFSSLPVPHLPALRQLQSF
jgi:hypothetical protein